MFSFVPNDPILIPWPNLFHLVFSSSKMHRVTLLNNSGENGSPCLTPRWIGKQSLLQPPASCIYARCCAYNLLKTSIILGSAPACIKLSDTDSCSTLSNAFSRSRLASQTCSPHSAAFSAIMRTHAINSSLQQFPILNPFCCSGCMDSSTGCKRLGKTPLNNLLSTMMIEISC